MKAILITLTLATGIAVAHAQFPSAPDSALILFDTSTGAEQLTVLPDENDGYYLFWLDARTDNNNQVFGQHIDLYGNQLWEPNGRLIMGAQPEKIFSYRIAKWQDGFLLSWNVASDSLFCNYLDTSGTPLWPEKKLIGRALAGEFIAIGSAGPFNVLPTSSGATIIFHGIYTGGTGFFCFNSIDFSGNLTFPMMSKAYQLRGYDYRSVADKADGFYALSKGNGLGSPIYIHRFNAAGDTTWSNFVEITGGGGPEGFGGNISLHTNMQSDLYISWDANNNNVYTSKILASGSFAWAGERISLGTTIPSNANRSTSRLVADELYVTWRETRNGNAFAAMQKISNDGNLMWTAGGVLLDTINSYYTTPKIAVSDSSRLTTFYLTQDGSHAAAQRTDTDGQVLWADGQLMGASMPSWIDYDNYAVSDETDMGCNALFWITHTGGDIYGAKLCIDTLPEPPVGVTPVWAPGHQLYIYPNPATDKVWISSPEPIIGYQLTDIRGRVIQYVGGMPAATKISLNIAPLPDGVYLIRCHTHGQVIVRKIVHKK